jgi:hypothetical protein
MAEQRTRQGATLWPSQLLATDCSGRLRGIGLRRHSIAWHSTPNRDASMCTPQCVRAWIGTAQHNTGIANRQLDCSQTCALERSAIGLLAWQCVALGRWAKQCRRLDIACRLRHCMLIVRGRAVALTTGQQRRALLVFVQARRADL